MKVKRNGRNVTAGVTSDGAGLISHAGSALVSMTAEKLGLTKALSHHLADI